ncbi:MAG: hypothetical protein IT284_01380 [Bacteroidetes bacterium]|nr:hypothetical protein [Bacteroidota bacterium]
MNIKFLKIFSVAFFLTAFLGGFLHFGFSASNSNFQVNIVPAPQCFDGQDNDSDGLTDYPSDPGCSSYTDDSENDMGGGGGGGGGGGSVSSTSVVFKGRAYPLSKVYLLKDGQIAASTISGPNAIFSVTIGNLTAGNYTFSVYGEDENGLKSSLFTFPVYITQGASTEVSGIFITPTIATDKSQVKKGDNIVIFGQGAPNSNITISVHSPVELFKFTQSDNSGAYLLNLDSSPLDYGAHTTKSKSAVQNQISEYGRTVGFLVGDENVLADGDYYLIGDLNDDGKVNLVDFSIAAFWYKKDLSRDIITTEINHLNADGKIDLVDFSIMAFHWTG